MKRIPLPCVEEMAYRNTNKWKVDFKSSIWYGAQDGDFSIQ